MPLDHLQGVQLPCSLPRSSPNPLDPGLFCLLSLYLALRSLPLASNPISRLAKAPRQVAP